MSHSLLITILNLFQKSTQRQLFLGPVLLSVDTRLKYALVLSRYGSEKRWLRKNSLRNILKTESPWKKIAGIGCHGCNCLVERTKSDYWLWKRKRTQKKKLRKGAGGRGSKNPIGGSGGRGPGGSASSRAVPHRLGRFYRWRFMERSPATATAVTDVANKWRRGIHGVRAWDERWSAPVISMVRRNPAQSKLGFSSISTTNSKKRTYGCHSIFLETWILGNLDIGLDYRGTFFLSGCFPVRIGNRADFGTG